MVYVNVSPTPACSVFTLFITLSDPTFTRVTTILLIVTIVIGGWRGLTWKSAVTFALFGRTLFGGTLVIVT